MIVIDQCRAGNCGCCTRTCTTLGRTSGPSYGEIGVLSGVGFISETATFYEGCNGGLKEPPAPIEEKIKKKPYSNFISNKVNPRRKKK